MKKLAVGFLVFVVVAAIVSLGWAAQASAYKVQAPLGARLATMTPGLARLLGLDFTPGVVVLRVAPNSPAARAGLQEKDIITAVNGSPVTSVRELFAAAKGA